MVEISENNYQLLFQEKKSKFSETFPEISSKKYFQSPYSNFRFRAEFNILKDKGKIYFAMTSHGKKQKIETFPIASKRIQDLMPLLLDQINKNCSISNKLFQVEFQSSRNDEAVITLVYHRKLDIEWQTIASEISKELCVSIVGRSKKEKIIVGNNFVTETYGFAEKKFQLNLYEQCFSQTNPYICDQMLNWVAEKSYAEADVMELHCGQGTFTILLSKLYRQVLATENSRPSVSALKENIKLNKRNNIQVGRLSGRETIEAYKGQRKFTRLNEVDLDEFEIQTVFLDPPRDGLDQFTKNSIGEINNIIYISCGFDSFKEDLIQLQRTHELMHLAMFDQFPYTDHLESGAILKKRI
tara:strand:+ start:9888 stop:10955 length:1068 start_codon:yes stop_codon:yes gene_type:complete